LRHEKGILMVGYSLTALMLFAARQAPPAPCTLAGPSVEANWSGVVPPPAHRHQETT